MIIRTLMIATTLMLAAPGYAQENTAAPGAASLTVTSPAEFGTKASVGNLFELESSTLALERAVSEPVKAFAQQMITDHTKAAQDMSKAAAEEVVAPATELDQRHQQLLDGLADLEGEEFDAAYVEAQVQAHDEAVALFEGYSTSGEEGALKQFAAATLPTLQAHQEHIHGLAEAKQ